MELPVPLPGVRAVTLLPVGGRAALDHAWSLTELAGRLTELSAHGASATATLAMRLVHEAQLAGEPAAWITPRGRCFYPPDAVANGIDLAALAIVRLPDAEAAGKACDYLVRTGAFGVVVLDLGEGARLPDRQLTRLLGLAQKHETAIVCLSAKAAQQPSLGALVSLRGPVQRSRTTGPTPFVCELVAAKDKRRSPGWRHGLPCLGPDGLR